MANSSILAILRVLLNAETAEFTTAMKGAEVTTASVGKSFARLSADLSGAKIAQKAQDIAVVVDKLGGVSKLTAAEIATVSRTIEAATQKMQLMGVAVSPEIAKLSSALAGLKAAQAPVATSTSSLTSSLGGLAKLLPIPVLSVTDLARTLTNMAGAAFEAADKTVLLANRTGQSTTQIQRFQHVSDQTGASVEGLAGAAFKLGVNLEQGTKGAKSAIAELGLSFEQVRSMRPEDQFNTVIRALEGVDDATKRNALGVAIFGKQFADISTAVADGYSKLADEAQTSSDAQIRAIDAAGDAWARFTRTVATSTTSALGNIILFAQDTASTLSKLDLKGMATVVGAAMVGMKSPVEVLQALAAAGAKARTALGDIELPTTAAAAATRNYVAELKAARLAVAALEPDERKQLDAALALTGANEDLASSFGLTLDQLRLYQQGTKDAAKSTKELETEQRKAERARRDASNEIQKGIMDADAAAMKSAEDQARARRQLDNEIQLGLMNTDAANMASVDAQQKAWREYYNWLGERRMEDEAAAMSLAKSKITIAGSIKGAFSQLPNTIMAAVTGGGDLGKSIGGLFGSSIFGEGSELMKKVTGGLTGALGKTVGGALGSIIPGLGTLAGSLLGGVTDKLFGKLFKSEGKKVNDMRDAAFAAAGGFDELHKKLAAAGFEMERLLKPSKIKDWEREWAAAQEALGKTQQNLELARQAAEEFGIPLERMGAAFKQGEIDAAAGDLLGKIDALVASGTDLATVIEFAGDDVGKFIQRSIEAGTTVPKELEAIAAKMIEQGTLIDANGDAFTELAQIPFAKDLNEQFQDVTDAIMKLVKVLSRDLPDAAREGADGIEDELEGIRPPRIRVPVTFERTNEPGDPEPPPFAMGGFRRRFAPEGSLALLHGVESIVPRHEETAFAERVLAEHTPPGASKTGQASIVVMPFIPLMDPYAAADEAARQFPRRLSGDSRGMRSAVERVIEDYMRTYGG